MPFKLSGHKAPHRNDRVVTTPGASIKFSATVDARDLKTVPALIIDARTIKDDAAEEISLPSDQLEAVTDPQTLKTLVTDLYDAHADYLEATEVDGKNAALAAAGSRKQSFFDALSEALSQTGLATEDYPGARRVLRSLEEETYMGHTLSFDTAALDSYHPYAEPFDKGVQKLEALAPKGIERDNISHELHYITDRKSKFGQGYVNERNAEISLHLRPIDRDNHNQTLSLPANSTNPGRPAYNVINVNPDGLPQGMEEYAGKAVFRSGADLYFDKSDDQLPEALHAHLSEKRASANLGLRRLEGAEIPRDNFPYDWNKNNAIDLDPIDTGWWGHCHIEAPLAALNVSAGSEVTVFDARSKAVKTFGKTDVNDLLFAMLDTSSYANITTSRPANVGRTTFVGNRNDSTGGALPGDKLIVEANGCEYPFSMTLTSMGNPGDQSETTNVEECFSPTVITDGIRFEKNPAFVSLRDTDWSTIDGERKVQAEISYLDVNDSGSVFRESTTITLDPTNPAKEPVLLGSHLQGNEYPPRVTKYYLNEQSGHLESRTFRPQLEESGACKMVPASKDATVVGAISNRTLSRELTKESLIHLHNHVLGAARRGVSFVTEKSSDQEVWNYGTDSMKLKKVAQDGEFTKYSVSLNTQGGIKRWKYILQSDQNGTPIAAHGLSEPADFVWRPEQSISAPLFRGEDGQLLYNRSALERGLLLDANGELNLSGMSFFGYASDVLYASLKDPDKDSQYAVINDQGELYFYEDRELFKAEVETLGGDTSALIDERVPPLHARSGNRRPRVASSLLRPVGPPPSMRRRAGRNVSASLVRPVAMPSFLRRRGR